MCNGWLLHDKVCLLQCNNTKVVASFQKSVIELAGQIVPDLMMVTLKNVISLH